MARRITNPYYNPQYDPIATFAQSPIPAPAPAPIGAGGIDPYGHIPELKLEDYIGIDAVRPMRPAPVAPAMRNPAADERGQIAALLGSTIAGLVSGDRMLTPMATSASLAGVRANSDFNLAEAQRGVDAQNALLMQRYADEVAGYEGHVDQINQKNDLISKRNVIKEREHDDRIRSGDRALARQAKKEEEKVRNNYRTMTAKLNTAMKLRDNNPTPETEAEVARILNELTGWNLPSDLQQDLLMWKSTENAKSQIAAQKRTDTVVGGQNLRQDREIKSRQQAQEVLLDWQATQKEFDRANQYAIADMRDKTARYGIFENTNRWKAQLAWDKKKFNDEFGLKKDSQAGAAVSEYLRRLSEATDVWKPLQAQRMAVQAEMRKWKLAGDEARYKEAVKTNNDLQMRMEAEEKNINALNNAIKKVQQNNKMPAPTMQPTGITPARVTAVIVPPQREGRTLPDPAGSRANRRETEDLGAMPRASLNKPPIGAATRQIEAQRKASAAQKKKKSTAPIGARAKGTTPAQRKAIENFRRVTGGSR